MRWSRSWVSTSLTLPICRPPDFELGFALTQIQPDPINSQIDDFTGLAVEKINGLPVRDLKHAYGLLHAENPPEFHVIELYGAQRPVIIPSAKVNEANSRVQANYGISKLSNLKD